MIALIKKNCPEVAVLCSRFGVQSLEVFGSAADGKFDPSHSDIDFLVEFSQDDAGSLFHRYFGLLEALEQLFDRKVDLASATALSNPSHAKPFIQKALARPWGHILQSSKCIIERPDPMDSPANAPDPTA